MVTFNSITGTGGTVTEHVNVLGGWGNFTILNSTTTIHTTIEGEFVVGAVFSGAFETTLELGGDFYFKESPINFLAWSKIGSASMEIDQSNEAGLAPMEWSGWMLRALQLGDDVIVYGQHGVTVATPYNSPFPTWGFKTLLKDIGLASPYAVAGNDRKHYFVDGERYLWRITKEEGAVRLNFKEHLTVLGTIVLNYQEVEDRLFIADGIRGFIYEQGLGGGYSTISDVSQGMFASPASLVNTPLELLTDIIDFGHRGFKHLSWVELGTDSTENLEISCDFRYTKSEDWRTSDWKLVNPEGAAVLGVTGVEFRLRVRQVAYSPIRLDYIACRHKNLDKRFTRGPLGGAPL